MATTYSRIFTLLQKAKAEKEEWIDIELFAKNLRKRKLKDFKVRGNGSSIDDYMSLESINKLIDLISDFELVKIKADTSEFSLLEKANKAVLDKDSFNDCIQSSVKSYLLSHKIPLRDIFEKIKEIKLPDVPDADTIFNQFKNIDHQISKELLRKVLFLYACAKGINRKTRVHYEEM